MAIEDDVLRFIASLHLMRVPKFALLPTTLHAMSCAAVGSCMAFAIHLSLDAGQRRVDETKKELARVQHALDTERRQGLDVTVGSSPVSTVLATWPGRELIDATTQFMSEQAMVNGLALRTLSVSRVESSSQTWGQLVVEVAASGAYADLKNWQGVLLARFHSLVVQSLRLQLLAGGGSGSGATEAQVTWVLYVRD